MICKGNLKFGIPFVKGKGNLKFENDFYNLSL